MTTLFPVQRRERALRVLMLPKDYGITGYSLWACPCCSREVEFWDDAERLPIAYREPCPWCGATWGRRAGERREVIPAPSDGWDGEPDGRMDARRTVPIYGPERNPWR